MLYLHHWYAAWRHTRLAIVRLDSVAPVQWVDAIHDPSIYGFDEEDTKPHAWSPDGSRLAVVAKEDTSDAYGTTAYVVTVHGEPVRQLTDRNLKVAATIWAGNGSVLALARRTTFAAPGIDTTRFDWWKVNIGAGSNKNGTSITSDLANVPLQLRTTPDTNEVLGIGDGRLVSLNASVTTGTHARVLSDSGGLTWSWPSRSAIGSPRDELFVRSARGDCYSIVLNGPASLGALRRIPRPTADATLEAVDPAHQLTVFSDVGPAGTALWIGDGLTQHFERKVALNQFVREIADPKRVLIHYVDADGDSLKGLILLPIGYTPGRRYPLVASVYGGEMIQDTTLPFDLNKQFASWFNLGLLPARGYALLVPSVPVSVEGEAGDPMTEIPKGIIGAVDEAVRVGIADPERLGIMGVSFGGYSTFSVITYTSRFHAAVSLAGYDDLPSSYGVLPPASRYLDFAYEMQPEWGLDENGQSRMGTHLWNNLWRFIRNSPYFVADRVQTPIMIIQGDMDGVGMGQGEEFFSAMYRLGKPAKLVRYWGEGHGIERSPANVRDMWHRVFNWFDEHLAVEQRAESAGEH
jgi:dipeptidyl aminopeptidase/acylaminoacyl peptidase